MAGQPHAGTTIFACGLQTALQIGVAQAPADQERTELGASVLRALLPAESYAAAYAKGAAMPLAAGVEEVLAFELPDQAPPAPEALAPLPAGLSPREAEVLRLVADGRTNREIAAELVLSVRTVENHVLNAYAKIGAGGRAEATAWAIRNGIAPA
jgi:DNA-binding NarL/FixJ family response regulator